MIVKCIELVNWMLNDSKLVLNCIEEMHQATRRPRDPEYCDKNLKNQVGKAILEFCENEPNDQERAELINTLLDKSKYNLEIFFEFESEAAAKKFLRNDQWVRIAGY